MYAFEKFFIYYIKVFFLIIFHNFLYIFNNSKKKVCYKIHCTKLKIKHGLNIPLYVLFYVYNVNCN